jgi:hypothetical protein
VSLVWPESSSFVVSKRLLEGRGDRSTFHSPSGTLRDKIKSDERYEYEKV